MNFLEFKRRLMTDPYNRDPEFVEARKKDETFAEAAAEADAFEARLQKALDVDVPENLAEDIIFRQSMDSSSHWRSMPRILATAASIAMAVAIGTFVFVGDSDSPPGGNLQEHLAWHWELDGRATLTASESIPSEAGDVRRIFSEFGIHLDHELMDQVRLSKFCPTPDGAGAHVVLATDDGPVTMFYLPRTQVKNAPKSVSMPNGMEGWVVNLERGSMALIAKAGRNTPELATEIQRQLQFPPGMDI